MTWFKIDDKFSDHPKVAKLQLMKGWQGALALWTLAGSWASRQLTNGAVAAAMVSRLGCSERDAELLVVSGLWEKTDDGYAFHDWAAHNPSREVVEEKRRRGRQRLEKWREKRDGNALQLANETRYQSVTDNERNVGSNANPDPTRPDPIPPVVPPGGLTPNALRPERFAATLKDSVRAAYMRANQPQQGASESQWREASGRVCSALEQGHFASPHAACDALAEAAVREALKPNGKLGFALQQAPFTSGGGADAPDPERFNPDGSVKTKIWGIR